MGVITDVPPPVRTGDRRGLHTGFRRAMIAVVQDKAVDATAAADLADDSPDRHLAALAALQQPLHALGGGAGGGPGPGPAAAAAAAAAGERLPLEDARYGNAVKVSQSSKIASVAGKIAHSVRARDWPTLLVAGNGSIHAAVKCCITAARFLAPEGLIVSFQPQFRDADHSRALLALAVLPSAPGAGRAAVVAAAAAAASVVPAGDGRGAHLEIKVSAHSRHAKVGAALSARLLEDGARPTVLTALGEAAVANAVMAAAHAAHYLAAQGVPQPAVQAHAAVVVKGSDQLAGMQLWVTLQEHGGAALGGGGAAEAAAAAAAAAALGALAIE
ncbi:MAG: hypothetical protein J3K34DRAFT_518423 [Monoraphidium minutum]|nr:MAG: hypothetical protein J3K34DRAFT_518423 [Monoraphidium minutum]